MSVSSGLAWCAQRKKSYELEFRDVTWGHIVGDGIYQVFNVVTSEDFADIKLSVVQYQTTDVAPALRALVLTDQSQYLQFLAVGVDTCLPFHCKGTHVEMYSICLITYISIQLLNSG